jgi:hypothetical protein
MAGRSVPRDNTSPRKARTHETVFRLIPMAALLAVASCDGEGAFTGGGGAFPWPGSGTATGFSLTMEYNGHAGDILVKL